MSSHCVSVSSKENKTGSASSFYFCFQSLCSLFGFQVLHGWVPVPYMMKARITCGTSWNKCGHLRFFRKWRMDNLEHPLNQTLIKAVSLDRRFLRTTSDCYRKYTEITIPQQLFKETWIVWVTTTFHLTSGLKTYFWIKLNWSELNWLEWKTNHPEIHSVDSVLLKSKGVC